MYRRPAWAGPLCLAGGLLAGCQGAVPVAATVSAYVPTVVRVRWTVPEDLDDAWVSYSVDGGADRSVDADDSGEVILAGIPQGRSVDLQLHVVASGTEQRSRSVSVETGYLGADLPDLSLDAPAAGGLDGGLLVTSNVVGPGAAMVIDEDGEVVWWFPIDDDLRTSRARLSRDGHSMLILPVNLQGIEDRGVEVVSLDGSQRSFSVVDDAHHDMVELPDGSFTFLVHEPRTLDGYGEVWGDRVVELSPDGTERQVWSTWDSFAYDPADDVIAGPTWTHANAIDYLEDEDAYLVGLLGLSAIVKLDRASGAVLWVLGTDDSDFVTPQGDPRVLSYHHQFDTVEGGLVVFENGPPDRASSRVVELSLDEAAGTATEVWDYWPDPSLYTYSMGGVSRLSSGRTVVNFATSGQVDVVEPDDSVVWRINAGVGGAFGYAEWEPSLGASPR